MSNITIFHAVGCSYSRGLAFGSNNLVGVFSDEDAGR